MITTVLQGRTGNNFYQIAMLVAYAKRHGLLYHIPQASPHRHDKKMPFIIQGMCEKGSCVDYYEPMQDGQAVYVDIPKMDNVCFRGYWQSFKYIDDQRDEILKAFNMPWKLIKGVVSIHVRRTDFIMLKAFSVMPGSYYKKCIEYFMQRGYMSFYVFSDDIPWCSEFFNQSRFKDCEFTFIVGNTDVDDLVYMSCCEHNITANSSFSFVGAWLNQNPDKIVLCPPKKDMWYNRDMVPDYFTQIEYAP